MGSSYVMKSTRVKRVLRVGVSGDCEWHDIASAIADAVAKGVSLTVPWDIWVGPGVTRHTGYLPPGINLIYQGDAAESIYYMTGFTDQNRLAVSISYDGKTFYRIGKQTYTANVRDPSCVWHDGVFLLAHSSEDTHTHICSSSDGINYTEIADITNTVAGLVVDLAYAPQLFVDADGSLHLFVPLRTTATGKFLVYHKTPTNAGHTTWSAAAAVTGTNLPDDMIDGYVVKTATGYRMWFKDETAKFIGFADSTAIASGYTVPTGQIAAGRLTDWASIGPNEGPCILQVDATTQRLYVLKNNADATVFLGAYYYETADDWVTWSAVTPVSAQFEYYNLDVIRITDTAAINMLLRQAITGSWQWQSGRNLILDQLCMVHVTEDGVDVGQHYLLPIPGDTLVRGFLILSGTPYRGTVDIGELRVKVAIGATINNHDSTVDAGENDVIVVTGALDSANVHGTAAAHANATYWTTNGTIYHGRYYQTAPVLYLNFWGQGFGGSAVGDVYCRVRVYALVDWV